VLAAEDRSPLAQAVIAGEGPGWRATTRSEADGTFTLAANPGEGFFTVSATGRVPRTVTREELAEVLLARGVAVRGQVLLATGGPPPQPCRVVVQGEGQLTTTHTTQAAGDGSFSLPGGLEEGEACAVFAFAPGFATPLIPKFQSAQGGLKAVLVPCGRVVVGGDERPQLVADYQPHGVELQLRWQDGAFWDVPPGPYEARFRGGAARVQVMPGGVARVDPPQAPTSMSPIRVVVQDRDGRPIEGARVTAWSGDASNEAVTDGQGAATVLAPDGDLSVAAEAAGRVLPRPATRESGDRTDVVLVLAKATVLEGRVFPAERAHLRLEDESGEPIRDELSEEDGSFRLESVPAGDYVLEVASEKKVPVRVPVSLPLEAPLHLHLTEDYGTCGHEH
jgi:hypothetical protein